MKTEQIQALLGGWDGERAQALLSWLAPFLEQAAYPVIDGVSFRPWGEVTKEELPEACFLVRGEAGKRTDLALPVWEPDYSSAQEEGRYTDKGPLNAAGVTAAWTAVNSGSRGNPPLDVPEAVKEELDTLKERVDKARAKRQDAAQTTEAARAAEVLCLLQEEAPAEQVWPVAACGPHELTQTIGNLLLQAVEDTADLTQGTGSYRAQAVLTVADVLNNNAPPQRYSRQTWEAALPALLQAAERGQLVGELMHPPGGQSDQARQCLRYRNLRWTETTHPQQGRVPALQGEVEIIPTEVGKTLIVQARNRFPIGFSSRGWGEEKWVQQDGSPGHYEIENFVCRTFDAVPWDLVASPGSTILYQALPDTALEPRTVATTSREIGPMKEAIQALLQALSEKGQEVSQWQTRLAELGEDEAQLTSLQQEVEAALAAVPDVTLDQATDGPVTVNVNLPSAAAPAPAVDMAALEQTIMARLQAEGWTRPAAAPAPDQSGDAAYLRQAALENRHGEILQEIEANVEPAFRPTLFQQMGFTDAGAFSSAVAVTDRAELDSRFAAVKQLAQSFGTWKPRPVYGRGVQIWVKDPEAGVPRTHADALGELVQYAVDKYRVPDKGLRKSNVASEFGPGPGGHEAWRMEVLQTDDRAAKLYLLLQNCLSPSTPYGGHSRHCLNEYIQVRQGRPLTQTGETTASDIAVGPFMVFPMVVSAFPQIILTEIADVQPLDREVGTIFYRKVLNASGNDLADITYWTSTYADYSGESTLGNPNKIQLSVTGTTVTAADRAFYIDASLKSLNRLQAYHNLDGMMLAAEDMATQIALSINFAGLGQMVAGISGTTAQTFGTAPASNYDGQDWIRDMFSRYVDRTSAEISMKRHGPATDIICGSEDAHWFENLNAAGFEAAPNGPPIGEFAQGVRFEGMIRRKYRVWSVAWWENLPGLKVYGGNSQMLFSRKGPQFGDTAFVYAPYVQQTTPELTLPSTMSKQVGVFDQTAMSVVNADAMALLTLAKGTTGTAI